MIFFLPDITTKIHAFHFILNVLTGEQNFWINVAIWSKCNKPNFLKFSHNFPNLEKLFGTHNTTMNTYLIVIKIQKNIFMFRSVVVLQIFFQCPSSGRNKWSNFFKAHRYL